MIVDRLMNGEKWQNRVILPIVQLVRNQQSDCFPLLQYYQVHCA
jgi:hypothetical protein